jgi:hypothetical protein
MPYYLVELYLSGAAAGEPEHSAARARAGVRQLARKGIHIRYLSSIFVPDDEICFHLIEAPSVEVVREASEQTQVPVARVSEVRIAG